MMRGYIGVTDFDWYRRLLTLKLEPEEVNFWQPSGGRLTRLEPGSPYTKAKATRFVALTSMVGARICPFVPQPVRHPARNSGGGPLGQRPHPDCGRPVP